MATKLNEDEKRILADFAEWLHREHTIVTAWAQGEPSETYQRPEQMVEDFLRARGKAGGRRA